MRPRRQPVALATSPSGPGQLAVLAAPPAHCNARRESTTLGHVDMHSRGRLLQRACSFALPARFFPNAVIIELCCARPRKHTCGYRTAPAAIASIAAHIRFATPEGTRVAKRPKAPHTSKMPSWRVTMRPSLHDLHFSVLYRYRQPRTRHELTRHRRARAAPGTPAPAALRRPRRVALPRPGVSAARTFWRRPAGRATAHCQAQLKTQALALGVAMRVTWHICIYIYIYVAVRQCARARLHRATA